MDLFGGLLTELKGDMQSGINRPDNFVASYLTRRAAAGHEYAAGLGMTPDGWFRDTLLAYVAGAMLEAGSDTTASVITTFVLFMLSNPHILARAREEIDRVVGTERMPTSEDEPKLPYLLACIKETLRIRPPVILGMPSVPLTALPLVTLLYRCSALQRSRRDVRLFPDP